MRHWFVRLFTLVVIAIVATVPFQVRAEDTIPMDDDEMESVLAGALDNDTLVAEEMAELNERKAAMEQMHEEGMYKALKRKFIEGNAGFMSLVALALILGLAFCVERIIYLTLSEVNTKKLLSDVDAKIEEGDIEGAKDICRETRGPVASICYQGLMRAKDSIDSIERSITSYGQVQMANLEKGCSWITLFIAIAPSLGFLGTVIGMVMAFDEIQEAGDINPTIVASGMKVALITTIFGIIVALILQVFYNYILNKIEQLTTQMEDAAITLLDILVKYKNKEQ
ncbi:MAG: MotA/TolQ/ExbB proton channel family protein [Prevotella sp.]|nr:MotA/TolQ/ExbB proton channel family protein [Prevotella sp.]